MKLISIKISRFITQLIIIVFIASMFSSCNYYDGIKENQTNHSSYLRIEDIIDKGPVNGGTINISSSEPDTLNPLLTENTNVQSFLNLIFESLIKLDRNQKPIPCLCESWEITNNNLEWILRIRKNVLWHDGTPLTANDISYTFDIIKSDLAGSIYKKNLDNVISYEIIDNYTFKISLKKRDSFTAEMLTFPIIQKKHYGSLGELKTAGNITPVGTGPYIFNSFKNGEYLKLVSNENWWNREKANNNISSPYITNININFFENNAEKLSNFQSNNVDIITSSHDIWYKYKGSTDIKIKKYIGRDYEFLSLNLANPVLKYDSVRKSISLSIDRIDIMESILPGRIIPSEIPLIPGTWLNNKTTFEHAQPDRAVEILEEDGWELSDGYRCKYINGRKMSLSFKLIVNKDNNIRLKVAEIIKEQLKKTGIIIEIIRVDWSEEMKLLKEKKYDIALLGLKINNKPDLSYMYSSSSILKNHNTVYNVSGYKNAAVDRYLLKILNEDNLSLKKAFFLNMKQIILDDVPYIGLYFYYDALLIKKKIRGIVEPYVWNRLFDITKWYIPEE